jgi:hypothetical protein
MNLRLRHTHKVIFSSKFGKIALLNVRLRKNEEIHFYKSVISSVYFGYFPWIFNKNLAERLIKLIAIRQWRIVIMALLSDC